jgi:primase-polymerase (primpol)-like protein
MTMPAKPETFGNPGNLPAALLSRAQQTRWVCWRWTWNKDRWDKPPVQASNPDLPAKSNDPTTWGTYADAVMAVAAGRADGIGYMLADDDLDAIDLDHCHDPQTGKIDPWAQREIDAANGAYVEVTVSGQGLRILGVGAGGELGRKWKIPNSTNGAAIEVYRRTNRYITVSGAQIGGGAALTDIDAVLDDIARRFDAEKPQAPKPAAPIGSFETPTDIDALITSGAPHGMRSEMFAKVVWALATAGHSLG